MSADPLSEPRVAQILLLEDSPSDRLMMKLALEESAVAHQLHVVEYGTDVLRFLRGEPPFLDAPRPDLILLDLNVPRMDGREILRLVKADPTLATIPVAVLTTSSHPADVAAAYEHHANCYLRKPTDFAQFVTLMQRVMQFWCATIVPPPLPAAPAMSSTAPQQDRALRLLLVEDSPTDATLIQDALAQATSPFSVTRVPRLTDAIGRLSQQQFDVIVTDLFLPDSQGVETIRVLADAAHTAPLVALTGATDDLGEASLSAGADEFLPKADLGTRRLERVVRHAIRRRSKQLDVLQTQRMQTVGRLASGVAHDMNNLLAAIRLTAEALQPPGAHDGTLVQELLANVARGSALTRQLLTFGQRNEMDRETCTANGVVQSAASWLPTLLHRGVALELALTDVSTTVMADVHQIEQAIVNLALNANDAMPAGGTVALSTKRISVHDGSVYNPPVQPGSYVAITVSDTGAGIPADLLPHLFEPFFTTKPEHESTGLGLATAREIARLHRGGIRALNRTGGGAEFTLLLPSIESGATPATPCVPPEGVTDSERSDAPTAATPNILLAEDDEAVARAMARLMRARGYNVHLADSADAAWEMWRKTPHAFDLLISDILMPGRMNVADLVRRIQQVHPTFPVVYCSGYTGLATEQQLALEEGVNFVPKPFEVEALLTVVQRQLATSAGPTPSPVP